MAIAAGVSDGYEPRLETTGSGPPLVFAAGMDGTGRLFHRQSPRLGRRFRVSTYRYRDDAPEMATLVADLARIVDSVSPDGQPVVLVGESFGGALSLSFTLRYPSLVRQLVVVNSFARYHARLRLHLGLAAAGVIPWSVMPLFRRVAALRMHSRSTEPSQLRYFLDQTSQTTRRGYQARLRILTYYDVRARLGEIRVPTLFLASERDHVVPAVREGADMASRVPNATFRVLQGQGHACLVAPDVDLDALMRDWEESGRASA